MVVKEISRKIFRIIALESGPTVHLGGEPMTVRKNDPAIRLTRDRVLEESRIVALVFILYNMY